MANRCTIDGCNYPLLHTTEQHLKINSEYNYWKNFRAFRSQVSSETTESGTRQDLEIAKKITDDKLNEKHA
jgi:hypothetical protein